LSGWTGKLNKVTKQTWIKAFNKVNIKDVNEKCSSTEIINKKPKPSLRLRWTRLISTTMIQEIYKENSVLVTLWRKKIYLENSAQNE
jgi:hypothetical protein